MTPTTQSSLTYIKYGFPHHTYKFLGICKSAYLLAALFLRKGTFYSTLTLTVIYRAVYENTQSAWKVAEQDQFDVGRSCSSKQEAQHIDEGDGRPAKQYEDQHCFQNVVFRDVNIKSVVSECNLKHRAQREGQDKKVKGKYKQKNTSESLEKEIVNSILLSTKVLIKWHNLPLKHTFEMCQVSSTSPEDMLMSKTHHTWLSCFLHGTVFFFLKVGLDEDPWQ